MTIFYIFLQKTTDDLYEQISEMKNEKTDLLNEIQILNEQIKCLKSEKVDTEGDQFCVVSRQDEINESISNIESSCAEVEKHENVDLQNIGQINSLTNIDESMKDEEKIMEGENDLFLDCSSPETELKISSKNNTEGNENNIEQLVLDDGLLKSELIALKEKVTLLTEENAKLFKKSLETIEGNIQDYISCYISYNNRYALHTYLMVRLMLQVKGWKMTSRIFYLKNFEIRKRRSIIFYN